jgi:hypothetical protein|nr:MAG TPA: Transcriptional regulator, MarR/EmrR family, emrR, transcriptional regulator, DNA-binding [Caudoviricetes sp.]
MIIWCELFGKSEQLKRICKQKGAVNMKRDMAIIREILLQCEQARSGFDLSSVCTSQDERDLYAYHVQLLDDGGYIIANVKRTAGGHAITVYIERMTWAGTELLESLRNESVFKETMKRLAKTAGVFSVSLVQSIAAEELKKLV